MKKLAVIAALLPMVAAAQVDIVGTIPNQSGSKITFTGRQGDCPSGQLMVYAQEAGGKVGAIGCYKLVSDQFFVVWSDGDVYTYDLGAMTLSEEAKQYLNSGRR